MKKKDYFHRRWCGHHHPMQADGTVDHALLTRLVDEQIQGRHRCHCHLRHHGRSRYPHR